MQTTIQVKAEHIAQGRASSAMSCPIALAIREQIPGCDPYVYDDCVLICGDDAPFPMGCFALPLHAQEFVASFDGGVEGRDRLEPFELVLDSDRPTVDEDDLDDEEDDWLDDDDNGLDLDGGEDEDEDDELD